MQQALSILHLHASFDPGAKEARTVQLMNAFGARARHLIVSADPQRTGATARIAPAVDYEIAQVPPPLAGRASLARYEAIARAMRGFDLVLSHGWGAIDGVMARRVFRRGAPPIVHHEDGFADEEATGLKRERTIYRRVALSAAQALVVPGRAMERIALETWKQPPARVHRIATGVDTALYAAEPRRNAIPGLKRRDGDLVIGSIGPLHPARDFPALVRACGGLSARFRLVIVGDGPERATIEQAALAMGIDDRVLLPGALERPYEFLRAFDLLALSPRREPSPLVVMQAMAAGLPIVSTPVGDVREMVAQENRPFVTEHHGEVRLRDAMQALAADPALRAGIGAANRARAVAEHDEATMIARLAALYARVAGRPGWLERPSA